MKNATRQLAKASANETLTIDEEELEERGAHSYCAGQHSTLQGVVGQMKARAAQLFSDGRDDVAFEVRRLANEFDKERVGVSEKLDEHIKRSIERSKRNRGER